MHLYKLIACLIQENLFRRKNSTNTQKNIKFKKTTLALKFEK